MSQAPSPEMPAPGFRFRTAAESLFVAVAFVAAYGQAPLYYSNQNQYLLHGLAEAGLGRLSHDWLAGTLDPTPLFSKLVAVTGRYLEPWLFQFDHGLLLGIYAAAMLSLFDAICGPRLARRRLTFGLLLVLTHSAAARWCSYRLFGQDYPWFFQAGVAGQYVLGSMFQPSAFGVLLIAAPTLFAHGRPRWAAAAAASSAIIHPTYLLPAGLLTLGMITALAASGQWRGAAAAGGLALILVLPTLVGSALAFGPTSPDAFAEAQDILVNLRIPHHTQPRLWLDWVAMVQIAWAGMGIALIRRHRLFWALAVPFALAAALTLLDVATGSLTMALLFPWRVSAVLVPVATAVMLARLTALPALPLESAAVRLICACMIAALAGLGAWISLGRHAFSMPDDEVPVMEFVRQGDAPGNLYFVPVRVPDLAAITRGSLSSDFKPLPDKKRDERVIPQELQRFRLFTGAPIYVDFKSVPFKDVEVIEWRRRLRIAEAVQQDLHAGRYERALAALRAEKVTHLVVPAQEILSGPGFELIHQDSSYRVYRLAPANH
jgi:hypothetical protein